MASLLGDDVRDVLLVLSGGSCECFRAWEGSFGWISGSKGVLSTDGFSIYCSRRVEVKLIAH